MYSILADLRTGIPRVDGLIGTLAPTNISAMSVTCDVFHLLMSALNIALPSNSKFMSVMSDVSQSPMSSVKDAVPDRRGKYGLAAQHWTPLALFVRQLSIWRS